MLHAVKTSFKSGSFPCIAPYTAPKDAAEILSVVCLSFAFVSGLSPTKQKAQNCPIEEPIAVCLAIATWISSVAELDLVKC